MGNLARKLKRKDVAKEKKEERKVVKCPNCFQEGFLRPHPDLIVTFNNGLQFPAVGIYEILGVVKCSNCGMLYDPQIKEQREQAMNMEELVEQAEKAKEERVNREKTAMSNEEFQKLREKYL